MKTKAAICRTFGAPLTIETVELADPGPGEVMIRTAACAICHSDISYVEGAWGGELPAVYGHEAAGVVDAVGPGVTRLKVGDHVVATLSPKLRLLPRLHRRRSRLLRRSISARPLKPAAGRQRQADCPWPAHGRLRRAHGGRPVAGDRHP